MNIYLLYEGKRDKENVISINRVVDVFMNKGGAQIMKCENEEKNKLFDYWYEERQIIE